MQKSNKEVISALEICLLAEIKQKENAIFI
jgi:hypothetical protein